MAREMIFNMLKFHSDFIAKKLSVWSFLLQNGTRAFPGSLYIIILGHAILDQRETLYIGKTEEGLRSEGLTNDRFTFLKLFFGN